MHAYREHYLADADPGDPRLSPMLAEDHGKLPPALIQVGEHEGNLIEVVSGLKGAELLASSNLNELVTGTKIGVGDDEGGPDAGDPPATGGQRRGGRGEGKRGSGEGKVSAQ